jgi:hypothetical protein
MGVLEKRLIDPTTVDVLYPCSLFGCFVSTGKSLCTKLNICLRDILWLGSLEPLYLWDFLVVL